MKILISPMSLTEAGTAVAAGADIIDIKNVHEGSLGAQPPWTIRELADLIRARGVAASATLGDLACQPGTAALAAFGAAQLGLHYLKVGLYGAYAQSNAPILLEAIRSAAHYADPDCSIVAAGYADYRCFDGLTPTKLVRSAAAARCSVVMLDTFSKCRGSLFDVLSRAELNEFIALAREYQLQVALAGSIGIHHLEALSELVPDIVGVRGSLCMAGKRLGKLNLAKARAFVQAVRRIDQDWPRASRQEIAR